MDSSSGFGSTPRDTRPIGTCFRCGSAYDWLNRPRRVTRRIILQKARRQATQGLALRLHVSRRFQDLFHSPRRGTFHRSLTVLCAIGHCVYVALGGGPPSFTPDFSCPALLKSYPRSNDVGRVPGCHGLWRRFPDVFPCTVAIPARSGSSSADSLPTRDAQGLPAWHAARLGFPRFARRYYGDDFCSSGYMRCFSSPGALRQSAVTAKGCGVAPFGNRRINARSRLPPAYRSNATSFFGTQRRGIHPLLILSSLKEDVYGRK